MAPCSCWLTCASSVALAHSSPHPHRLPLAPQRELIIQTGRADTQERRAASLASQLEQSLKNQLRDGQVQLAALEQQAAASVRPGGQAAQGRDRVRSALPGKGERGEGSGRSAEGRGATARGTGDGRSAGSSSPVRRTSPRRDERRGERTETRREVPSDAATGESPPTGRRRRARPPKPESMERSLVEADRAARSKVV